MYNSGMFSSCPNRRSLALVVFLLLSPMLTRFSAQVAPTAAIAPSSGDYAKEAFVIEQMHVKVRFENDGKGSVQRTARVRVQNEGGVRAWGQLPVTYNSANDSLDVNYLRVRKPDGSVVTAGPEAIQETGTVVERIAPTYTDLRQKQLVVPGLRPGDVLEFQINDVIHTPQAPGQFWTQYDFNRSSIVLDEQFEADLPADCTIKLKSKPGLDPTIIEANGRRIYRWTSSHLEPEEPASNSETSGDKPKKKKIKPDEFPAIQISTFSTWEDVGRWYAQLEQDRRKPTKEVSDRADELTRGLTTDLDRVQALYDYVAKNFRYVSLSLGVGRYQPRPAAETLRNLYGDCKDKNTLLAALLEAKGFHSSSVLIHSSRKLDPDVPSPAQFDHAITLLLLGGDEVWMDTTTEVAPFRLLLIALRNKQALVIPQGGTPRLERTPANPPFADQISVSVTGKIEDSGRLQATVSYSLRGDGELAFRALFRAAPATKWQTMIEGVNKSLGGDVSDVKVADPADTRQPFTFSYSVSKANYLEWSKKKSEVPLPLATFSLANIAADAEDDDSSKSAAPEPLKLGAPGVQTYHIQLELASRYHVQAPIAISLQRDYATYTSSYKIENGALIADRKYSLLKGELPPALAGDYRSLRHNVAADEAQRFMFDSSAADTSTVPSGMSAADLVRSGNTARNNGNYALAINLLNRAVETDPKNRTAWNDLALAYFADRQDGLAINAYQKQIAVNPYDENAYNNLGRVYLRQRKYDDAIRWFQKQIEVQPLDKYAHTNLGITYFEQHKYQEALPEFEKAATITPDSAEAQARLGHAYLNLGQDDKAMAAYDAAVKISATPPIWNNIAYNLAQKNAHLDRARNYTESAISSITSSLRNVSLAQVQRRDLNLVSSLAAYWDTLGWVAFGEGKLDDARRYVEAAWQLGQSSDEGDHLGQIDEKLGDKNAAAHDFALAMNTSRPETETRGRLVAAAGSAEKADALIAQAAPELVRSLTYAVANPGKLEGTADFFVLLGAGPANTGASAVADVSFISGNDTLKPLADSLRALHYNQKMPADSAAKIIRRGRLSCKAAGECSFVLVLPQDARPPE